MAKERLGASGVQLGKKLVVEGQEIIEFIAASAGREDMVGKVTFGCSSYGLVVLDAGSTGVSTYQWHNSSSRKEARFSLVILD